jgi:hypothetical protein
MVLNVGVGNACPNASAGAKSIVNASFFILKIPIKKPLSGGLCFTWLKSDYETESIPVLFQSTPAFGGREVGRLATHQAGAAALI